jgi:cytidine deaminase
MSMQTIKLDAADTELIHAAEETLKRNYHPVKHSVGCAVRCASGKIYTGVNIESCGYGPCAEPIAIGAAITAGERKIVSIVAVHKRGKDEFSVLSPCGNCRQLIIDYAPEAQVIFTLDYHVVKATARHLLPGAYLSDWDSQY